MSQDKDPDEDVWFEESDVNIEMLMDIFNTNTFSAERIESGVVVRSGFAYPISITIDDYSGVLKLRADFSLKENFDEEDIIGFIDHINENTSCAAFYLHMDKDGLKKVVGSSFITYLTGFSLRFFYTSAIAFSSSFIAGCKVDEDGAFFDFSNLPFEQKRLM